MKKLFTFFTAFLIAGGVFSQAPNKFSYQAIVRNASGGLLQNSKVGIKINLLHDSAGGTAVYAETHSVITNSNGLATIEIGGGTVVAGDLSKIDWADGPYFIKTEIDLLGGTSYTITGSSQLLSVPYALFAANGFLEPGSAAGNTPYWNGSAWVTHSNNIYNNGKNIGIGGTTTPSTKLDIAGGNNWDLKNGEGDFRIGDSQHRLKIGVAMEGGGAGAVGIMQYGHPGGYNVLSMGAQGNYLFFLNGNTQKVGIGIDNPTATLDIQGTIRVADGSQGVGKVLTSDANGLASWAGQTIAKTHFIKENYGGGIVFYVYDNGQHGLIAATVDQSTGVRWHAGTTKYTMARADGVNAGKGNTEIIIASQGYGDGATYAARVCNEYKATVGGVTYGDWYLPSKVELNLLYLQKAEVGGFTGNNYWSSTEFDYGYSGYIFYQNFTTGFQFYNNGEMPSASLLLSVRAIRAF